MSKLTLNCDLGELADSIVDAAVMPYLDCANIACGKHAGNKEMMLATVKLAKAHKVSVGAHPSYDDRENFGRVSITYPKGELIDLIAEQISSLKDICETEQVSLNYVKPHGALYNDMMRDLDIFDAICQAIMQTTPLSAVMIQALTNTSDHQAIAKKYQLSLIFEAFADRNYQDNGLLVPRSQASACIENKTDVVSRCQKLFKGESLTSVSGKTLNMRVDSLCVHGDNTAAIELVKALRELIDD